MTTNAPDRSPYLRTSRNFPEDPHNLCLEINKSYIDIANAVNSRTISFFTVNKPLVNGENWFFNQGRQQGFRQVYIIPASITSGFTINIGFKLSSINKISPSSYGSFTDGTNWYGIIYATNVAIAGAYSFYVNLNGASTVTDQITILVGVGAPTITSGIINLEWISDV